MCYITIIIGTNFPQQGVDFPLVEDMNLEISSKYGVLNKNSGCPFRAFFVGKKRGGRRERERRENFPLFLKL